MMNKGRCGNADPYTDVPLSVLSGILGKKKKFVFSVVSISTNKIVLQNIRHVQNNSI